MKQLLLCISLFILIGCSGCQRPSEEKKGAVDTLYTEPMAMSMYMNDPERALAMIDSGVAVGNISPQRGEYLKAVTYYAGLHTIIELMCKSVKRVGESCIRCAISL